MIEKVQELSIEQEFSASLSGVASAGWSDKLKGKCNCFQQVFGSIHARVQDVIIEHLSLSEDWNTCMPATKNFAENEIFALYT